MIRCFFLFLFCLYANSVFSQDSAWAGKPNVEFTGFIDVFYCYDFNRPLADKRQAFFYNYNRHNETALNLGFIKVGVGHQKYRANLALQTGTYPNDNYAAEPGVLKNVFEANVGISLNKKDKVWLDAGIFPSHIGFESAVSMENWTLTRSILAENSPYYLSGAKLGFKPNDKWGMALIVCNGWQRIKRVQANSLLSWGTQLSYKPNTKANFNWSTFLGTDDPDSTRRIRVFNNLYAQYQLSKKMEVIAGVDVGLQQTHKGAASSSVWFSPVFIMRYHLSPKFKTALRMEYYQDQSGLIIAKGFQVLGLSANLDYYPVEHIACRIEGRWLKSKGMAFPENGTMVGNNFFITTSISVKITK